jgi:hypothetical protein
MSEFLSHKIYENQGAIIVPCVPGIRQVTGASRSFARDPDAGQGQIFTSAPQRYFDAEKGLLDVEVTS